MKLFGVTDGDGYDLLSSGLPLRRDFYALIDHGYVTGTPDLRLVVSRRIREDFENGRDYFALQGRDLWEPGDPGSKPSRDHVSRNDEKRFLA